MEIYLAAIAVVISVVTLIYHVTSAKRIQSSITHDIVTNTTNALSSWAKNFETVAEQVIAIMIDERLQAQSASANKAPAPAPAE